MSQRPKLFPLLHPCSRRIGVSPPLFNPQSGPAMPKGPAVTSRRDAWQPACVPTRVAPMTVRLQSRTGRDCGDSFDRGIDQPDAQLQAKGGRILGFAADGRSFTISTAGFDDFRPSGRPSIPAGRCLGARAGIHRWYRHARPPVTTIRFPEENIKSLFQLESRSRCSRRSWPRQASATPVQSTGKLPPSPGSRRNGSCRRILNGW